MVAGCGEERPTAPGNVNKERLAGGGRQAANDPFRGGPGDSGPGNPGFERPQGYSPLFYSDIACGEAPKNGVITNQTDFQTWWTVAVSCLPKWDSTMPWFGPDDRPMDSSGMGIGWPTGPINPYGPVAPALNFDTSAVVAITLEPEETLGRSVWVKDVKVAEGVGTVVHYEVIRPGPDCMILMMPEGDSVGRRAPTTAVLVPKRLVEPVTWERSDTVMSCRWEPDPKTPTTLYYTDAPCELGATEVVITDEARFKQWIETALACDAARWRERRDSINIVFGDSGKSGGGQG